MTSEQKDLVEELEALLENYLEVLDEYEQARKELSAFMSSVSSLFHHILLSLRSGGIPLLSTGK
jgi:hypothetical protein